MRTDIRKLQTSGRVSIRSSADLSGKRLTIPGTRRPAVTIESDNITIDLTGVNLSSGITAKHERAGIGIYAEGRENVTIRGVCVSGYKHNIVLKNCEPFLLPQPAVESTVDLR